MVVVAGSGAHGMVCIVMTYQYQHASGSANRSRAATNPRAVFYVMSVAQRRYAHAARILGGKRG